MTSANSANPENVLDYNEYGLFLRARSSLEPIYFFFDNRFNLHSEIPVQYQGQKGLSYFVPNSKKPYYENRYIILPLSTAAENISKEVLNISFTKDSLPGVLIDRTVSVTGYFKSGKQIKLSLPEETEKRQAKLLFINDMATSWANSKKTATSPSEVKASFEASRLKWKDQFKEEIAEYFGQNPLTVNYFDVKDYALRNYDSCFIYTSNFNMGDWVKRGGNNYIFEAGKLVGDFSKIGDRDRKIDIYMPSARTFDYTFNIQIPEGYRAKGTEAFNKNVINNAGSFISTVAQKENLIIIHARCIYNNAFELVTNWPLLLEIMDAFDGFSKLKILFEQMK